VQRFGVVIICSLRPILYQFESIRESGHSYVSEIVNARHRLNVFSCKFGASWKSAPHKNLVVNHKIALHALHRRVLKELFYVNFSHLNVRNWLSLFVDAVKVERVVGVDNILLWEIKIFYNGVDSVLFAPLNKINKHGFNIVPNKLSSSAKPQQVMIVELPDRV